MQSHRRTTHHDPPVARLLMVARSVGVDSRNRGLRLKERRKLETESAGRRRGREGGRDGRGAGDALGDATAVIHFPDGREIHPRI